MVGWTGTLGTNTFGGRGFEVSSEPCASGAGARHVGIAGPQSSHPPEISQQYPMEPQLPAMQSSYSSMSHSALAIAGYSEPPSPTAVEINATVASRRKGVGMVIISIPI